MIMIGKDNNKSNGGSSSNGTTRIQFPIPAGAAEEAPNNVITVATTKKLKFALEGLTCSSCVMTVNAALKSFHPTNNSHSDEQQQQQQQEQHESIHKLEINIQKESIRVSLLPNPQLEFIYSVNYCYNNLKDIIGSKIFEKDVEKNLVLDVIDLIESIGFEGEFMSSKTTTTKDDTIGYPVDSRDNNNSSNDDPKKSVHLNIQSNAKIVFHILCQMDHVSSVKFVEDEMKKKIKKQHKKKQKENILTAVTTTGGAGNKANDYIEVGNNNNNNDDDDDDIARKSLSIDNVNTIGITSSNSFNGRATIEIFYDSNKIGIRTILSQIQSNPKLESQSGCCTGTIDVTDISSYQTMIAKAEARRKAEITQYFHSFLIAACCAIPVFLVSMVFVHVPGMKASLHSYIFWHITWEEMIAWVLTTPVQFYSGARFYREAYYSIKTRHLGMGFLIASGTSAAYFYSVFVVFYNATRNAMMGDRLMQAFETSALLIMFVLLGKWLECKVKSFTSNAISKLSRLAPETATLVGVVNDDNKGSTNVNNYDPIPEEQIPLILLQKNDVLLVRPGEKVPTDGVVIQGSSSIDESMLTGESMPVHKENQCLVIGGTINIDGAIYIQVNAIGKDTALSKIIELIESAQSSKAPIQEYADRIASKFVPLVTGIALFTYVIWAALLNSGALNGVKDTWPYKEEGLNDWTLPLLFSISCLVIACPCALGLATPTALMVGSGISAKHGVLIKGGEALETTSKLTAIVFDKTGTLTYGKPVVKEILLLSDRMAFLSLIQQEFEENEVHDVAQINERALRTILTFAACAECGSEHPLAKGIISKASEFYIGNGLEQSLLPVQDFIAEIGTGIKCTIRGFEVIVGNRRSLQYNSIQVATGTFEAMEFLEKKGRTTIVVSINGRSEAVIGLSDTAREEAAVVIATLQKDLGVKPFMLTGDNARTAQAIASEIGIPPENVISDVLPEGKVDCIKKLQGLGEIVAMVGDGVNDSPAIVQADVGIAIGAGTDIAIETAGIVLMNSKLTDVLVAIDLSKTVFSRIKMNFVWALGYNTLAIPIAAGVLYPAIQMAMPPFMAAVAMILSSISVLISSLLLRLYRVKSYSYQIENEHITASGDIEAGLESLKREGTSNSDRGNETYLIYPGCTTQWQKPCSCPPNTCKCGNGCCAVSP